MVIVMHLFESPFEMALATFRSWAAEQFSHAKLAVSELQHQVEVTIHLSHAEQPHTVTVCRNDSPEQITQAVEQIMRLLLTDSEV